MSPLRSLFWVYVPFTSPFKIPMSPLCPPVLEPCPLCVPLCFFTSWLNLVAFHSIFGAFLVNFFVHLYRAECLHHSTESHLFSSQSLILYQLFPPSLGTSYHVVTRSLLVGFDAYVWLLL